MTTLEIMRAARAAWPMLRAADEQKKNDIVHLLETIIMHEK